MRFGTPRLITLLAASCVALGLRAQTEFSFLRPPTVCFPPGVPALGEEIADQTPGGRHAWSRPPEELADYVGEYFYPALSTRLIDKSLSARLRERLEAYRSTRGALLNELADQLLGLHAVEEPRRTAQLREFAEQQSPRIAALEKEAEALRRDLVNGGLLNRSVDWNRDRPWRVGGTRFSSDLHAREAEFQVVRAAAFYQNELLPEQRGLLLEAAMELRRRARAARPIPGPREADTGAFFFSPATSRLRLPAKASPELAAKVGRYNQLKVELTKEIVQAVWDSERADYFERTQIFKRLADAQWPRFGDLEELAEGIRALFATLPPVKLATPPYVPATLMARVEAYQAQRKKIIDEFNATMRAASDLAERPNIPPGTPPEERRRRIQEYGTARNEIRAKVSAKFQETTQERLRELRTRYDSIQEELKQVAAGQVDPETGRPLDAESLIRTYAVAMERFATFGREEVIYSGYRTAMLMPGLSPEQRRLLFTAAVRGLAQPLPWGETIPSGEQPVPRS